MRRAMLYEASVTQFKEDVLFNRITDIMSHNFKSYFGTHVQDPEFNSWQNSLQHVKNIVELAKLKDNKIERWKKLVSNDLKKKIIITLRILK